MASQNTYRVAMKRLTAVEVDPGSSHQHEIQGVKAFKEILGEQPHRFPAHEWIILEDSGEHEKEAHGHLQWGDRRSEDRTRGPEWRGYYSGDTSLRSGDLFMVIELADKDPVFVGVRQGSSWESQIHAMFGTRPSFSRSQTGRSRLTADSMLRPLMNEILEIIGADDVIDPEFSDDLAAKAIDRFGKTKFPTTYEFSRFAREISNVDSADPDTLLMEWWNTEMKAFFSLERVIYEDRIKDGLSFDEFLSFSLTVHNRRKSRAGHAFQNHLRALFCELDIKFSFNERTEGKRTPDFLMPGIDEYRDDAFDPGRRTFLGAKTTCKDRWRQVLSEASKIKYKHLCTLEPRISRFQLKEMDQDNLTLVVPKEHLGTYDPPRGVTILTIQDFCDMVKDRQAGS